MARVRLGEVATERRETHKGSKSGYPVVGLEHLIPENINLSMWDESGVNTFTKMFHKGDVLFGRRRAYLKKAVIAPFDGICSGDITVIVARPEHILPELLPFVIQNESFFDYAVGKSAGSLSPRVKWEYLREYEFDLPAMDEQRKLARVLWAVNDTIEAYNRLMGATEELVRGQFAEMFGGYTLDSLKYPTMPMNEVFDIASSRRILKSNWTDSGVPFLRVRDMVRLAMNQPSDNEFFVSEEFYTSLKDSDGIPQPGDILVSATSTIGKCYEVKDGERFYYKDADILRFRKKIDINASFFINCMKLPVLIRQIEASVGVTTVGHFLIEKAKKLIMPIPPYDLQQQFADFVHQADKSKSSLQKAMTTARNVSRKIISDNLK